MSKSRSTRSKIKEEPGVAAMPNSNTSASALRKVFYISNQMLDDSAQKLSLERFYHPGKAKPSLFITKEDQHIMEVMEFAEPRRSWLINSEVCSNGHIYLTTSIDTTFLALHHLRKHCTNKALSLDSIHDEEDPSVSRIMNNFVRPESLKCIADVKKAGDMIFYKYHHGKCMAWLSLKTKHVASALKKAEIHCGHSAVSQNFMRSEKAVDETAHETDYLRVACDYVGSYLSLDLHDELIKHLRIPSEIQAITEEKKCLSNKRKSVEKLDKDDNKKQKVGNGVVAKLRNSSVLDESPDDEEEENRNYNSVKEESTKSPKEVFATPLKERSMSAKEKSLAKSAKGTKSISSFFTKKAA